MLTKIPPLAILSDQPFTNDTLDRKTVAENLTTLCENARTPFVIAIDGKWWTGKTTFLDMWSTHLKNKGFVCLNYNAWESDYAADPGTVFIGEIQAAIDSRKIDLAAHPGIRNAWSITKKIGSKVLSRGLPLAVKLLTHGIVDAELAKKVGDKLEHGADDVASLAEKLTSQEIKHYADMRRELHAFREQLGAFASSVSQSVQADATKKRPLIFMIDELDRCRPTFAVELLERLKHVFSVEGILFILGVDAVALSHSIKAVYGTDYDATDYLRRFFDLRIELARPDAAKLARSVSKKLEFEKLLEGRSVSGHEIDWFEDFVRRFATKFQFSIRTIEQIISELYALVAMTPRERRTCFVELAAMVCVKHANSILLSGFLNGTVSAKQLCEALSAPESTNVLFEGQRGAFLFTLLLGMSKSAVELPAEVRRAREVIEKKPAYPADEKKREEAQYIVRAQEHWDREGLRDIVQYVRDRILLLQKSP